MVLWNDELAAELIKQPRGPVGLEVNGEVHIYGAAKVYTTWDINTGEQVVVVSAIQNPEVKSA